MPVYINAPYKGSERLYTFTSTNYSFHTHNERRGVVLQYELVGRLQGVLRSAAGAAVRVQVELRGLEQLRADETRAKQRKTKQTRQAKQASRHWQRESTGGEEITETTIARYRLLL
jgi:hypothetical protein